MFAVVKHLAGKSMGNAALQQSVIEHLLDASAHFTQRGVRPVILGRRGRVGHLRRLYSGYRQVLALTYDENMKSKQQEPDRLEPLLMKPAFHRLAHFG